MANKPSILLHAQGSYIAQAASGGSATVNVVLPSPKVQKQNRIRFQARLRHIYEQQWEQSLQGVAFMTLGLTETPDAVFPTDLLFLSKKQPERRLPPDTSILQVYDDCHQELLILGEPGTGKSTLLLKLARQLLERAEQDAEHPLPVILPLSSWTEKQPLQDWISTQLSIIYKVPLQLSRGWVLTNQVFPLLDGLDELPQKARGACIKAITSYRKKHLIPLVVSSRRDEYKQITCERRLALHSAVVIEPLNRQEVETYLTQAGPSLAAVQTVLKTNPVLQELMTTPLMLNVIMSTYMDARADDVPQRGSADVQRQQILDSYVKQMVKRKGNAKRYPLPVAVRWLSRLAREMQKRNQTIFFLEQLQPDWLSEENNTWYRCTILSLGYLLGMLVSIGIEGVNKGFVLLGLLFAGPILGWYMEQPKKIEPAEELTWSLRLLLGPGLFIAPVFGLVGGLAFGLIVGWFSGSSAGLLVGSFAGLFCWSIVGLSGKQLTTRSSFSPNEGMRRSAKNGLFVLVIFGLLVGLLARFSSFWLPSILILALLLGLFYGLRAVIHHYTLRFWLWYTHLFPLRAVPFLEDAANRVLLRRVGGGYSFMHRLLLEYFADLNVESS